MLSPVNQQSTDGPTWRLGGNSAGNNPSARQGKSLSLQILLQSDVWRFLWEGEGNTSVGQDSVCVL